MIDCQSLLTSVRKGARCADCSSPLEVRENVNLGFLGVRHSFIASHFLECPLGPNKSYNTIRFACFVEASMIWPFTVLLFVLIGADVCSCIFVILYCLLGDST